VFPFIISVIIFV